MASILVIDDDAEIRSLVRVIIQAEGHETIGAASAADGLIALELRPDAIFVDVDMPGMTGAQFLMELRKHPTLALTPATFITGHPDRVAMFAKYGIAEEQVVSKPFRRKDIHDALGRMLGAFKRRNLRVSLSPGDLHVEIDGVDQGIVSRLSEREVYVRLQGPISATANHTARIHGAHRDILCNVRVRVLGIVRGEARLALVGNTPEVLALIAKVIHDLLSDAHAREDQRVSERVPLSASVSWDRNGDRQTGFLRDISATGAYIVTDTLPAIGEHVMVYLPWQPRGALKPELRGAEASVARHGADGFGCSFTGGDIEFFVALTALISDGTVISGETSL